MKRSRTLRRKAPPALMLTSLLDMFTIILIFLIVSFEGESHEFKLNPDLVLPESSAKAQLKTAVNLAITTKGVTVGTDFVAPFEGGEPAPEDVDRGFIPGVVEVLEKELEKQKKNAVLIAEEPEEPIIVVQADRKLSYATLYLVLRSAANAGFFKYRLAILKS